MPLAKENQEVQVSRTSNRAGMAVMGGFLLFVLVLLWETRGESMATALLFVMALIFAMGLVSAICGRERQHQKQIFLLVDQERAATTRAFRERQWHRNDEQPGPAEFHTIESRELELREP